MLPPVIAMLAAGPALLVSEKLAGVAMPVAVAVTVYAVPLAKPLAWAVTVAVPAAPVVTVALGVKVALGTEPAGAAKVTVTPLMGLPLLSVTVAIRGFAKLVLMATF